MAELISPTPILPTGALESHRIAESESYLEERTGSYEKRAVRYRLAARKLFELGMDSQSTLLDVGAGWTEFDYCLRREFDWRGRYIPLDASLDGVELEEWEPPRSYDFFAALELFEHLSNPLRLMELLQGATLRGGVATVPDPERVDVFAMDETHHTEVDRTMLEGRGFEVQSVGIYGGHYGGGDRDGLLASWQR